MERFSTCWDDRDMPYLQPLADTPDHGSGKCFCDTQDKEILSQVLNNYDQETVDFYRWSVDYDRDAVSQLVARRSGIDLGRINCIEPLERGESGRIYRLRISGDKRTIVVGKELEIRRILSETHLKSSAFEAVCLDDQGREVAPDGDWCTVRLNGNGWGHGVGLCQIGAAVMASEGYTYKEILEHYYPGTEV